MCGRYSYNCSYFILCQQRRWKVWLNWLGKTGRRGWALKRQQRDSWQDLVACFGSRGEQAVWQGSVRSGRVQELPQRRWKHGGRTGIKFPSVVIPRQPEGLSTKLLLSNPAVPFDPGSKEITLSLMFQDDIIKIGHVFEVRPLKASKEVWSVAGSEPVCFSKTVRRDMFI